MKQRKEDKYNLHIDKELATIDSLLRNEVFALEIANALNMAYYVCLGEITKPLLSPWDDTASVKLKMKK